MPFYEYKAENLDESCSRCAKRFEVMQGIKEKPLLVCPDCGSKIVKLISKCIHITLHKQVNQYNDVKGAKYWRDADGNRHRVTPTDGDYKSPTVSSKRKRTDQEVAAIKKRDAQIAKKQRSAASYKRFEQSMRRTKR